MAHNTSHQVTKQLIDGFTDECEEAFTELFRPGSPLRSKMESAARRGCDSSLVDDAVNETLFKLWALDDKATRFRATSPERFTGLVCVAAANMARDVARKQQRHYNRTRRAEQAAAIDDFMSDPIDDTDSLLPVKELLATAGGVDADEQHDLDIIELRLSGYSYGEISDYFNRPGPWANNRIRTIRKRLETRSA